ncbi:hypothetical protein XA68_16285 [Ophiocordyceps unilateralis]|uniref:Uncharacterized protein n=1 Tax=Ophiocordyceps unilateralis TaxID=268505 RepID=A0A2A9P6Q6_OPHUN|nr:hypothetical protein XA68_16285 [Ophiocordyceps unilateralis]
MAVDNGPSQSDRRKRPCPAHDQPQAPKRVRFTYGRRRPTPPSGGEQPGATITTPPRLIRTLGTMDLGKSVPASVPFDMGTPVWRKIREQPDTPLRVDTSPSEAKHRSLPGTDSLDLRYEIRCLRHMVSEKQLKVYEAIILWLDGLLRSTASGSQDPHRRSLLSICLRNIPACIAHIEAYDNHVARVNGRQSVWDASHVSSDLYEQLEALGSCSNGWRPIKLALRAHAIWFLSEAVAEGLLEPQFVRLLIRLCLRLDFREEAGKLSSCVEAPFPPPRTILSRMTEDQRLLPLHEMLKSLRGEEPLGAALLSISSLVSKGSLPVSWLSTQAFSAAWESSVEFLTTSKMGPVVTTFISTCLPPLASGEPPHQERGCGDNEQTLISFIAGAVVAATTTTASRGVEKEQRRRRSWRRVLYVLELCLAELRNRSALRRRRHRGLKDGQFILVLARYLVVVDSPFADLAIRRQAKAELKQMAQGKADGSAASQRCCHQAVTVLTRLTQYRSRISLVPGREIVAELCAKLDDLGLGGYFSSGLRTDVAFLLAQQTKDLRDLAFAESLPSVGDHGLVSTIFPGWHWEEGISEWVLPGHEADRAVERTADGALTQAGRPAGRPGHLQCRKADASAAWPRASKARLRNRWMDNARLGSSGERVGSGEASGQGQLKPLIPDTILVRRKSLKLLWPPPDGGDWDDLI